MAIVYKGENIDTNEIIAIKMLKEEFLDNKEFVAMFEKEAEIAKLVRHVNMVNTYDVGISDGCPYMIMEYVQGRTLKEYISMKGIIPEDEAIDIAIQACDAMIYAHEKKLIHRDIKSQNILLNKDGIVKVGDFGIARMTTSATMTMGGSNVLGSVHYMSPEQAMGNVVDHTTDIYSLGIVMYEMLTGTLPFKGDTPVTIALKHVNDGLPSPMTKNHELSEALNKIIMKAANKHKDSRYQSAQELKEDLIKSKEDKAGSFVEVFTDDGDTKEIPVIKKENIAVKQTAAQNSENPPKDNTGKSKEITDIGWYENETLRQNDQDTLHRIKAASRTRKIVTAVLAGVILIIVALVLILIFGETGGGATPVNQKTEVPDVEKTLVDEATKTIKANGFDYAIEYVEDDEYAEGIVISQSPKGGMMVESSIIINLKVSKGPQLFAVPDITNISFTEAIAILEDAGFEVGNVSLEVSDLPKEYIVRQEPKAGTDIPIGEKVDIWIATQQDTTIPVMPNVVGRTLEEAIYLLDSIDIGIDRIEVTAIDSGYDENIVIYHEPETDTVIEDGQKIVLYVSNGEEEKYSIDKNMLLSLTAETTKVRIVYIDEGNPQVVYEKTLAKGDHNIKLTFYTNTPGDKDIIIYYDGVESGHDRVTFEVLD